VVVVPDDINAVFAEVQQHSRASDLVSSFYIFSFFEVLVKLLFIVFLHVNLRLSYSFLWSPMPSPLSLQRFGNDHVPAV
jgi:hypothetical protein